jgi:lantibiotic modifying enzyme
MTQRSAVDLEAALGIASDIAAGALWSGERCAFLGAVPPDRVGGPARQAVLGGDLYEGSAGIARFLALAASLSDDVALRRAALGGVRHALERTQGWSLFSGRMGVGMVALEIATLLDEPGLVQPGVEAIETASEVALAEAEQAPADLLAGMAGVVVGLAAALPYDLDGGWLARAFDLGRALLGAARPGPTGLSWPMLPGGAEHLCGLGHGASGVALALDALAALAPQEPGWAEAAAAARGYERGWFSAAQGSWADLRTPLPEHGGLPCPHFWCHGSVGIGLERLRAMRHCDGPLARDPVSTVLPRADAAAALEGVIAETGRILASPVGPGGGDRVNGSLCHGIGSLVELLAEAWTMQREDELLALMRRLTAFLRNDAGPGRRWRSGIPGGGMATPGLMMGSAGIGWAMLRTWSPEEVPAGWLPRIAVET